MVNVPIITKFFKIVPHVHVFLNLFIIRWKLIYLQFLTGVLFQKVVSESDFYHL